MVLRGASSVGATMVLLLTLLVVPTPGSAWHEVARVPAPDVGSSITYSLSPNLTLQTTFTGTDERYLGHHETRDVVLAKTEWLGYGHTEGEVFDAGTGFHAGRHYSGSDGHAVVPGLVEQRFDYDLASGSGPGLHAALPEAVLWGRSLGFGGSWSIPVRDPYCADATSGATARPSYDDHFRNVTGLEVTVWRACSHHGGTTWANWTLSWDAPLGPIADERMYTVQTSTGQGYAVARPALFEPGEGAPLPFRGASHVAFWAERDHSLRYAPHGDVLPADPEPHAEFDIGMAAELALGVQDEDVRVFLSRAEAPFLSAASRVERYGMTDWALTFADRTQVQVRVHLYGVQAPGGPFVVREASAELSDDTYHPVGVPEVPLAHPGDLARLADRVAAERGEPVSGYGWALGHEGAVFAFVMGLPQVGVYTTAESVRSSAVDGVVESHDRYGWGLAPDDGLL